VPNFLAEKSVFASILAWAQVVTAKQTLVVRGHRLVFGLNGPTKLPRSSTRQGVKSCVSTPTSAPDRILLSGVRPLLCRLHSARSSQMCIHSTSVADTRWLA